MTPDAYRRPPWWKGSGGEWWVVGQGILLAAIALAPAAWEWTLPSRRVWTMLGALFMIAGFGLAAAAALELGTNLSPLPRPRRHGVLVRTGVYARARHPIYGGIIIAALGWALWRTSGVHLLLAGAAAPYLYAKTLREEAFLRQRYPDYDAYRAHTKHLIPGIF